MLPNEVDLHSQREGEKTKIPMNPADAIDSGGGYCCHTFLRLGNGRNTSAKVSLKQLTLYSISPSLSLKWSACIKHTSAK